MDETVRAIETFRSWVADTPPGGLVFFGGAGVSTESGIPDFRSPDGLYAQKYPYPPEQMVSRSFFDANPSAFFDFYCDRMLALDAQPNRTHRKLAELEQAGTLAAVVTQNIDGLHQKAGSKNVLELHGSVLRNFCMACGAAYSVDNLLALRAQSDDSVPRCPACGGIVKPDVVQGVQGGVVAAGTVAQTLRHAGDGGGRRAGGLFDGGVGLAGIQLARNGQALGRFLDLANGEQVLQQGEDHVFVVKRREHAQEVFDFGRSEIAHATPQSASGRTRSSRPAHSMMLR